MINGASGQLMAAPPIDTSPPDGPPTGSSTYLWSGDKVGVTWTNGDSEATTEIYSSTILDTEPSGGGLEAVVAAGLTSKELNVTSGTYNYWFIRHKKNDQYSDWEIADDPGLEGDL